MFLHTKLQKLNQTQTKRSNPTIRFAYITIYNFILCEIDLQIKPIFTIQNELCQSIKRFLKYKYSWKSFQLKLYLPDEIISYVLRYTNSVVRRKN